MNLCTPQQPTGCNTFVGSYFDMAYFVGKPKESISCCGYMTPDNSRTKTSTIQDMEEEKCRWLGNDGVVTCTQNCTTFFICTRSDASHTRTRPILGQVVEGLDMLRQAIAQHTPTIDSMIPTAQGSYLVRDASEIRITGAGVDTSGR